MKQSLLTLISCFAMMSLGGCSQDDVGNTSQAPPNQSDVEKRIAEIDANPNMPAQAKEMAKAMARRNGSGQQGMGKSPTR